MHACNPADDRAWLRLERASLRLGGRLFLRDIDWSAHAAEQWALLGANGAGKTVLAELALGRRQAAGGTAWLDPTIERERDVGWVSFEAQRTLCEEDARHDISDYLENALDTGTTVATLLAQGQADAAERARVVALLGIGELQERGIRFLSSGEARRTLLARLLLRHPRVAVLDNPFEGIDAASREAVGRAIEELLHSPVRVLLLTRRAAEIPAGITHVLRLQDGRVVARGARAGVLSREPPRAHGWEDATTPLPVPRPTSPLPDGPLIELEEVSAHYGEHCVLDRVSLRLERGEHLCIAGPNGCGKSTLLSLICGDNPRAYGQQVRVLGRLRGSGEPVWELKRHFGIVSNALHLGYPPRTRLLDVLLSGYHDTLGLYQACGALEHAGARAWLEALHLGEQAGTRFGALSFGAQRMLLIARAMVKAPPLLILDEPCSGLDGPNRERALALIDRIAASGDTQILYVSHEAGEMPRCITRRLEFRRDGASGSFRLVETLLELQVQALQGGQPAGP